MRWAVDMGRAEVKYQTSRADMPSMCIEKFDVSSPRNLGWEVVSALE